MDSSFLLDVQNHLRDRLMKHVKEYNHWDYEETDNVTLVTVNDMWVQTLARIRDTPEYKEFVSLVEKSQSVIEIPDDWREYIKYGEIRKLNNRQLAAMDKKKSLLPIVRSFIRTKCLTEQGSEVKTPATDLYEAFTKSYPELDMSKIIFGKLLVECLGEENKDRYHRYLGIKLK